MWGIQKRIIILGCFLMFGMQCLCFSQQVSPYLEKEIEDIKKEQEAIKLDIQLIKTLLIQRSNSGAPQQLQPQTAAVNIQGMVFDINADTVMRKGNSNIVMVEFSDYQCPYCGRYVRETFPKIVAEYVDSGKLDYAVFDFPLASHDLAPKAAEAARCAREQGKYWEMRKELMSNQDSLDKLAVHAATLQLDAAQFQSCLDGGHHTESIARDQSVAASLGITGVPAFVFALKNPLDPQKVRVISVLSGARPLDEFRREIERVLPPSGKAQ